MDPKMLPEFVHDLSEWTRRTGGSLWAEKGASGSPFYWPPGITNQHEAAQIQGDAAYEKALRSGLPHQMAHQMAQQAMFAVRIQVTGKAYAKLAEYHATTLERAKLFYIGNDISFLAARTEMKQFRLDLDLFRLDPTKSGSIMSCGFMMWDTPIGESEPRGQITALYDNKTGDLEVSVIDDMMFGFRDSDTPVNALSWRILPESEEVLIIFYTDGNKARRNYEKHFEEQKKNLPPGMKFEEDAKLRQLSDPQPLEREQVLPLNTSLAWFEDKSTEDRLRPTITSDPAYLREAERFHVQDEFSRANEKVLPMLSQMVKTFVATLAVRRMKIANQQVISPQSHSAKRMRRAGASPERQQGGVQVVSVGSPIKRRASSGTGGGKWTVKTIVGPVIRTRQYVPAHDEYRDGIWEIEPYIAGPADAPWSENIKVFLLDDSSALREAPAQDS